MTDQATWSWSRRVCRDGRRERFRPAERSAWQTWWRGRVPGGVLVAAAHEAERCGHGALAAAKEPGIGAVVAGSPCAVASELLAQETARGTQVIAWLRPERAVSQPDYPALVTHGDSDTRIPVGGAPRPVRPPGTKLWMISGVGRLGAFEGSPYECADRVSECLDAQCFSYGQASPRVP